MYTSSGYKRMKGGNDMELRVPDKADRAQCDGRTDRQTDVVHFHIAENLIGFLCCLLTAPRRNDTKVF
jgi:hypothetical protein